ncbi:hypothetical protein BOTBODRAFT_141525 [Botryobasidium botryosum FD-172 SS1]|uniref:cysteine synthase n=1 Tax=Botryobasidium botryosum (strain FD-172 SS1) TaxID=930990 RepID=A0A067N2L6_BOTB1|nr:hypothetical protein BOTBODRAFT_141525 [Botryobasidium botryosum FD-172 SS1]
MQSLVGNLSQRIPRDLALGVVLGFALSLSVTPLVRRYFWSRKRQLAKSERGDCAPQSTQGDEILNGVLGLIGNTPLIRINSLSDALGVEILGKCEFLNPGGSVKDRVALRIIEDAEKAGILYPNTGSRIFEGTVGSTGISLAMIAKARGYEATIIMPDDVAAEKSRTLEGLGARVEKVRPASIVDKKQFVNLAKKRALEFDQKDKRKTNGVAPIQDGCQQEPPVTTDETRARGFFADQFENLSNYNAHFDGTGPEIWRQTGGRIDAFVSGAGEYIRPMGTGGTIAGIGAYLKKMTDKVRVVLADPEGSGLYNKEKVKHGVMYNKTESEGTRRRHQVDTVVEGIGINRLTSNFELALPHIDDACRISDAEAVSMSRYLVHHDGLFLGSSSACNLVACVCLAKQLGQGSGKTIVTILCDSGNRHYSKCRNDDYLRAANIPIDMSIIEDMLIDSPSDSS